MPSTLPKTFRTTAQLLASSLVALAPVALAQSFDTPIKQQVLDLGPSPYYSPNQKVQIKLSCYFFPTLMVKEYDEGQKGAEWLSIVSAVSGQEPACGKLPTPGEKIIKYPEWTGYFMGVKGSLVFFRADDGMNGGLPFAVYDSKTETKIFHDNAYDADTWNEKAAASPFDKLRVSLNRDQHASLQYLRVVVTDCDLYHDKSSCWQQIRKKINLKEFPAPTCRGYEEVTTRLDSVIAYPVEVTLLPEPAFSMVDGPVLCWPVD
jgi:hypothetical protein